MRHAPLPGAAVKPIGIVLLDMPRMLREIVIDTIEQQPDMEMLGEFFAFTDALATIERTGAEFLVTDVTTAGCGSVTRMLDEHPFVRVLGIADDGDSAYVRASLGAVSPPDLAHAIRTFRAVDAP